MSSVKDSLSDTLFCQSHSHIVNVIFLKGRHLAVQGTWCFSPCIPDALLLPCEIRYSNKVSLREAVRERDLPTKNNTYTDERFINKIPFQDNTEGGNKF